MKISGLKSLDFARIFRMNFFWYQSNLLVFSSFYTIDFSLLNVSFNEAADTDKAYRDSDNVHHAVTDTKHQTAQRQGHWDCYTAEKLK